nr:LysR family transcriptional regulator [Roseibium litorale]
MNKLKIFLEVARTGSFSAAAARLGIPASRVSRNISELETDLGTILLLRTTRRVSLTEAGTQLLDITGKPIETLDQGINSFLTFGRAARGTLRIATSVSFALTFLPEILADYGKRCPEVKVDVATSHRNVNLTGDSIDVAIRTGEPADSNMIYRKIGQIRQGLFAAPGYCSALKLSSPDDLHAARFIAHRARMNRDILDVSLSNGQDRFSLKRVPALIADDPAIAEKIAISGAGIAFLSYDLAADSISRGLLQPVLPQWSGPAVPVYYLVHRGTAKLTKIAEFLKSARKIMAK